MADFSMVSRRLATGAALSSPDDVQQLIDAGITHVIDCQAEQDDRLLFTSRPGITYLWNPTEDNSGDPAHPPKPPEWWQASLDFALACYATTLSTCLLAHCAAGVNRGPSTAYAIIRACWGLSPEGARLLITTARPQAGIGFAADFEAWWKFR